jgi:hypothetical protein
MSVLENRKEIDPEGMGEEVYSKAVRAGRRTYFFDVKATRGDDYFLTITESRKKQGRDGSFTYDKHKIYLYKEDFAKFAEGLEEVVDYVRTHKPEFFEQQKQGERMPTADDIDFDRL